MVPAKLTELATAIILATAAACLPQKAQAQQSDTRQALSQSNITEQEAFDIAKDAYIYAYPLVTMEMTRRVMTNTAEPTGFRAPMGQFANMHQYPTPDMKDVTTPNADTLYSAAWIDVGSEPWVLSLPEENGRYYLVPLLSAWTDVIADPGTRTTGTGPQTYAITGPNWDGTLPEGMERISSPTNLVWLIGRTYCTGTPEDYRAVWNIQDGYRLVPLSAYGKLYAPQRGSIDPSVDMRTPVRDQVNRMNAEGFFRLAADLMKDNPPAVDDAPIIARFAKIGIVPGREFDFGRLDPAVKKAMEMAPKAAQEEIAKNANNLGTIENGWVVATKNIGLYGTDYLQRATVTMVGLGANLPEDAVYPGANIDSNGNKLNGANRYTIHFNKGQMPPVNGFWSLTMYDGQLFFVPNALNRYTLSGRNKFTTNEDGSVDLYIQTDSPGGEKENNWLPAPDGDMHLTLRLYWPKETPPSILDGTWQPPKVERVEPSQASRGAPSVVSRGAGTANAPAGALAGPPPVTQPSGNELVLPDRGAPLRPQ